MSRSRKPDRLIRPLHRQRGRHKTVRVLGEEELTALLGVTAAQLPERLTAIGWRYHEDSAGRVWATEQTLPEAGGPAGSPGPSGM